jgi:hypothetical protein
MPGVKWQDGKMQNGKKAFYHLAILLFYHLFCGIDWNRTSDTRIFSPLLYHLSYDARSIWERKNRKNF